VHAAKQRVGPEMRDRRDGMSLGVAVVLAGSAMTLIALLLPWWDSQVGATANGFHDWGWLTFFALVLAGALLLLRLSGYTVRLSVSDATAWMAAGAVEVLGAVAFWFGNNTRISGGVRYGVFIGVIGGALTLAGGYLHWMDGGAE